MSTIPNPVKFRAHPPRWPFLRCCDFADHLLLLGELERDGLEDADVARILPRARRLLAGQASDSGNKVPWWVQ